MGRRVGGIMEEVAAIAQLVERLTSITGTSEGLGAEDAYDTVLQ